MNITGAYKMNEYEEFAFDENELKQISIDDIKDDSGAIALTPEEILHNTRLAMRKRVAPWQNNHEFENENFTIEEVTKFITNVASYSIEESAALAIIYLTGSRVGEVIGNKFKDGTKWEGVRQKDIKVLDEPLGKVIKIRTMIEKHNDNQGANLKTFYRFRYKNAYIPVVELYKDLIELLEKYSDTLNDDDPELLLFPNVKYNGLRTRWHRFAIKCGVHVLRHWRASHLVRYHGFSEADLRLYFGWSKTSDLPTRYTHNAATTLISKSRVNLME